MFGLCETAAKKEYTVVGQLDANNTLWNLASTPGKFVNEVEPGMNTTYASLQVAAKKYASNLAVGSRRCLTRTKVDGFEKVTLSGYSYLTYAQYFAKIEAVGSGSGKTSQPVVIADCGQC